MRIWTVQPVAVWGQVARDGAAWVDPRRLNPDGWVPPQSSWLSWQLRERIAGSLGRVPWFAYGERPDLRCMRHGLGAGETHGRIEFEPPADRCVTFPCWAWHRVYGGRFLSLTAAEERDWRARVRAATGVAVEDHIGLLPDPLQRAREASWCRLFRPDLPVRSWRRGEADATCEAVVEVVRSEWVRRVTWVVGTGRFVAGVRKRLGDREAEQAARGAGS